MLIEIRETGNLDEYNAVLGDISNVLMRRGYLYQSEVGIYGAHLYLPNIEE